MPFLIPILASVGGIAGGGAATGAAILGGGAASVAGAALGAGSKTSTSTPTLTPEMQTQQSNLMAILQKMMADPTGGLGPQRSADAGQINQAYAGMPNTVTQMLASRGFGSSGKVGDAVYNTEGARLGAQSDLYGKYAKLGSDRQLSATQIMDQIINQNRGESKTTPGNGLAAGLLSGGSSLTNLVSLHTLMQLMNGSGSGGSFGSSASVPFSVGSPTPGPTDPMYKLPDGLINRTGTAIDGTPSLPAPSVNPSGSGWGTP